VGAAARVRLFLAFELPEDLRVRIAERVEPLRSTLPPASWVPAERLHLTLAFLGEVEEPRVTALDGALRPVFADAPRLCLRLAGPGTFPPARPARVAWIGVEASAVLGAESMRAEGVVLTTPEARAVLGAESMRAEGVVLTTPEASLAAIERRVREVLAAVLQHPLEDRPYHAHVTVARPRRPWGREAVARFRSACDDLAAEWEAARAVLMESQLGRDGARYSVCRDYVLDGATS
jgi:2'-5' RNA ligase